MKLDLYINNLVRKIEKKIGKKETLEKLGVTRKTVFCWKTNKYPLGVDQLEQVCILASEVLEENMRLLFMDGLIRLMEDRMNKKKKENIDNVS